MNLGFFTLDERCLSLSGKLYQTCREKEHLRCRVGEEQNAARGSSTPKGFHQFYQNTLGSRTYAYQNGPRLASFSGHCLSTARNRDIRYQISDLQATDGQRKSSRNRY